MQAGLCVQWLTTDDEPPTPIAANGGVFPEELDQPQGPRFVPRNDWRPLDAPERDILLSRRDLPLPDAITLVRLDPDFREWFWDHTGPIACAPEHATPEQRREALWAFSERLIAGLPNSGLRALSVRSCDVQITPPGQTSTAYNHRASRYVGMHIDNHDRLPLDGRRDAFQLLAVNLGQTDRYLQFANLGIPDLLARIGTSTAAADLRYQQEIWRLTRDFFRANPDYPLVRITLPPDYGYVAVTQYLIHDGATNDRGCPDVALLLAGRFERVGTNRVHSH